MKISISASSQVEEDIITNILKVKGIDFRLMPRSDVTEIIDNKNCIRGLSIVIEYLDERFPQNPLLPSDILAKAQVRMLYRSLLEQIANPQQLSSNINSDYAEYYKDQCFLFQADGLSIVDVIIYTINPYGDVWKKMRAEFEKISEDAVNTFNSDFEHFLHPVNTGALN